MTGPSHGMPHKVLVKALQLGIHNDCLIAVTGACDECMASVYLAFDYYYQGMTDQELLLAITEDIMKDRIEA